MYYATRFKVFFAAVENCVIAKGQPWPLFHLFSSTQMFAKFKKKVTTLANVHKNAHIYIFANLTHVVKVVFHIGML